MTDALTIWRERLAGVTPGPWEAQDRYTSPGRIWQAGEDGVGPICDVRASPRHREDTAHIVRSDRLSRILADETTVEGLARVIDPDAFKTKAEWYEYLGPRMADQVFARLQSDATVERMSGRRKAAIEAARAVLNHLAQLALGEET